MTQPLPPSPAIAEIVTFALTAETDADSFVRSATALDSWLATAPGFAGRRLSRSDDGRWTDHVLWTDRASALTAAAQLPARPEAAAFLAAIDPESVTMRHEVLAHLQDA